MDKRIINSTLVLFLLLVISRTGLAQDTSTIRSYKQPTKIAVFAPLFLDSAFDNSYTYRYGKDFPKFLNPGVEFYEGVQLALDSLGKMGLPLDVYIYDTRSAKRSLSQQLNSPELKGVGLLIAYASAQEVRIFANAAASMQVPFINANMPNDGGVTGNPNLVLLNPTLRTQCESIYQFIQKNYATSPLIVFRKKGQMEDIIKKYFEDYAKMTASVPLQLKYVDLPTDFSQQQLQRYLDSNTTTVVLAGSLEESFGRRLATQLATLNQTYPVTVVGMPTWDNFNLNKQEYKGLEIVYSTPFYNAKTDKLSNAVNAAFTTTMSARPSDMVFRGYEVTWRFAQLLAKYGKDIGSNFIAKDFNAFTSYDIQPVFLDRNNMTLDYFENKHLYFIKYQDGHIKAVY